MRATGKARKTTRLMIEIRYLANGEMEWCVCEPDTRKAPSQRVKKWRRCAAGWQSKTPTWDELHSITHASVMSKGRVAGPPMVIESIVHIMQYDIHCMSIEDKKRK